jgi:hypothetical protein
VGEGDTPRDISRYTVSEAARQLRISPEAVRNRLSRGTLRSVKEGGTVYVLLEADRTRHTGDSSSDRPGDTSHTLLEEMRGRIEDLREQLRAERRANAENRRIIAALTSRIPELEAPSQEPREAPETATEQPGRGGPQPAVEGAEEPAERHSVASTNECLC